MRSEGMCSCEFFDVIRFADASFKMKTAEATSNVANFKGDQFVLFCCSLSVLLAVLSAPRRVQPTAVDRSAAR